MTMKRLMRSNVTAVLVAAAFAGTGSVAAAEEQARRPQGEQAVDRVVTGGITPAETAVRRESTSRDNRYPGDDRR